MLLSVVIVNYNVKHFLEQCLQSVFAAGESIDLDVWVVDNNSTDGSVQMVRDRFPQVHLIANSDNPGFAKANDQALKEILGAESGKRKAESEGAENGERRTENGLPRQSSHILLLTSQSSLPIMFYCSIPTRWCSATLLPLASNSLKAIPTAVA